MNNTALYPGSFDPFTLGHKIIVDKSLSFFDKVVIAVGINTDKRSYLSIERRIKLIEKVYAGNAKVEIVSYSSLTADLCREMNINFIIRGIRNVGDFEFERNIAQINKQLNPALETIFLMTPPAYSEISSSVVREILSHGANPMQFMPEELTLDDLIR